MTSSLENSGTYKLSKSICVSWGSSNVLSTFCICRFSRVLSTSWSWSKTWQSRVCWGCVISCCQISCETTDSMRCILASGFLSFCIMCWELTMTTLSALTTSCRSCVMRMTLFWSRWSPLRSSMSSSSNVIKVKKRQGFCSFCGLYVQVKTDPSFRTSVTLSRFYWKMMKPVKSYWCRLGESKRDMKLRCA